MKRARPFEDVHGRNRKAKSSGDDQIALLKAHITIENNQKEYSDNVWFFHVWSKVYWGLVRNAGFPDITSDEFCWCRCSNPDQNADQLVTRCPYIACNNLTILQAMAKMDTNLSPTVDISDCYYCTSHNTFHVCSDSTFVEQVFEKDKPGESTTKQIISLSSHQKVKARSLSSIGPNGVVSSPTFAVVFGSCKYQLLNAGAHSDFSTVCVISKKIVSGRSLQIINNMVAPVETKKPVASTKRRSNKIDANTATPNLVGWSSNSNTTEKVNNVKPLVQSTNLDTKYILLSRKAMEEFKDKNPIHHVQHLLTNATKTKPPNGGNTQQQQSNPLECSILSRELSAQRRKSLDKHDCYSQATVILHMLFNSSLRTKYHQTIVEKKWSAAFQALKQYHQKKAAIKELPIGIESFMLFCSTLATLPSQSGALPLNIEVINQLCELIYKQWIIVCLSPYGLKNESAKIDFTSVALAVLFSMRRGGRTWGCQRIIQGNPYVMKYLCAPNVLEHFGFKKKQLTEGTEIIQNVYELIMFNDITIPQQLFE